MESMRYLCAAYMAIWILLALFLYSIHSREKKLQLEVRHLRELLEKSRHK